MKVGRHWAYFYEIGPCHLVCGPIVRQCLDHEGLPVFALAQSRPSLDDVYLQATGRTLMDAELALAGQRDLKQEKRQSMR